MNDDKMNVAVTVSLVLEHTGMADNDVLLVSEWGDLTVAQLKEELVSRGLETTGRKSDLVSRLDANDRGIIFKIIL